MTDRYAVFGNPIAHSKSPQIHRQFADESGQALEYGAVCIEPDQFEQEVGSFLQGVGKGLNITVPFKERAWAMCQQRSAAAERAGAVNTLYRNAAGQLCGDNTDGIGLVQDLRNHGVQLDGARVLMLGAGGAARGVVEPLMAAGCGSLTIGNRTAAKAQQLAQQFGDLGEVQGSGYAELPMHAFDLIINATSASLQGELPPMQTAWVGATTTCYDMMYGAEPTAFCRWAGNAGAVRVLDGLGMLVEQAAAAFLIWRGVKPNTAPVIAALRAKLS